jgi:VanZ family protein
MGLSRTAIAACRVALVVAVTVTCYLAFTPRHFHVLELFWDKLKHAAAFATLALLVDFSFPASRFGVAKMLLLLGYGVMIEFVQYFLPYREASSLDVLADVVGIALYVLSIPVLKLLPWFRLRWQAGVAP